METCSLVLAGRDSAGIIPDLRAERGQGDYEPRNLLTPTVVQELLESKDTWRRGGLRYTLACDPLRALLRTFAPEKPRP